MNIKNQRSKNIFNLFFKKQNATSNNKILITGGASGIRLGLTDRFVNDNITVLIYALRVFTLEEVPDKKSFRNYMCLRFIQN